MTTTQRSTTAETRETQEPPVLLRIGHVYERTLGMILAETGFYGPIDIAVGRDGVLYVLNRATLPKTHWRIGRCEFSDEEVLGEFGTQEDEQPWPVSLAIDGDGILYVTDEHASNVSMYTTEGELVGRWGEQGDSPGAMDGPTGVRLDADENLWIVDSCNHRVQKFTRRGQYLDGWGEFGAAPGQLNYPWGLAIDPLNETVLVADWRNHRVQRFSPEGELLQVIGRPGGGDGEFNYPSGVVVDKYGDIYVADRSNHRVQLFNYRGGFVESFRGDAMLNPRAIKRLLANKEMLRMRDNVPSIEPEKRLKNPTAVAVDEEGRLYITESGRFRVQVYRKHCISLPQDELPPPDAFKDPVID